MWLTRLSITRPVTILMLVLALVVLGLQSRSRLPVDLYPDIEFPMVVITTIYPGTGPEEVETLISKPIEDSVSTISGLKKLTSTSSEGVSQVMMEMELGTNVDVAMADIRSKLDVLRNRLPEDAEAPTVMKADVKAIPIISLSLTSDRLSSIEVRRLADDVLKDRLSQVQGVASVFVSGGDVREIQVRIDQARLQAYGLSIQQVVSALQAENLNLPSGAIDEASRTSAVRVMGEFTDPEQILNVRIPNIAGSTNLTVRDVVVGGVVDDTVADANTYTRVDGGNSVALTVQKQSDGNTVKVVEEVRKELENLTGEEFLARKGLAKASYEMQKKRRAGEPVLLPPDTVAVKVAWDQSKFIEETLEDVYKALFEGALLAVLIVFLFLHSIRGTFIVALAIPTSMIATFLVMNILGFSINMMSMMGLSLSVGILVDDSIVVLENIHRHLKMGKSVKQAAIDGRMEIGLAAMTITLVDVVVFVPIAFMGGIVGQFFRQFGIVVATATLFSLFVSFTLTPMLASRWLKSHEEEEEAEERGREHPGLFRRFFTAWEAGYSRLEETYRRLLLWALDHRPAVIALGLMTFVASIAVAMPKPTAGVLAGVPLLLVALILIIGIWWVAWLLQGAMRVLYVVVALVVSIVLAVMSSGIIGKISKAPFTPMIPTLMVLLVFGVLGYMLSLPRRSRPDFNPMSVFKPLAVGAVALILVCLFIPAKFGQEFVPKMDQGSFTVTVEAQVGTALDTTDTAARLVEETLLDRKIFPQVETVFTTVGASGGNRFSGASGAESNMASMNVQLVDFTKGMLRTDKVIEQINDYFANTKPIPGVKVSAAEETGGPGGAMISIEVTGDNMPAIQRASNQIADVVRKTEGTYGVELSWRSGRPELQAHIDRDRAAQYGVSVAQIASALRTSLEGDTSTKYRENGKEYDIRVYLPEEQRDMLSLVPTMVVGTRASGQPLYLYEVATFENAVGPTKVERTNRQRSVTVQGNLMEGYPIGNVKPGIDEGIAQLRANGELDGVTVKWAGQAEEMAESFANMFSALGLSILMVFMLMSALFESLLSPLIIMLAVPQAMAGALFALSFSHKSLNIVSMIGVIMLVGLVTKNAILVVDYTNTLRRDHKLPRRDALLRAGPTRLRPILMTTMAMIFGMLPTALALNQGSEMRQPMAIAVIGGLLLSMFLTLLMVPVFYEILDDLGQRVTHFKERLLRIKPKDDAEPQPVFTE
ncbi:MAG: Multidrug resistance protein MdtB [bacterium ADurb.Bin429]|nr:MAG: Multidrug resistance protein MdtB [bacterium ADurb.Bin429]